MPRAARTRVDELDEGHADIGPALIDGAWEIRIKDDSSGNAVWRDPADVVLRLGDNAEQTVPEDGDYAFLGSAGDPVFLIPQTRLPDVLWLGWNTQHEELQADPPASITFSLHDLEGPGDLHVFFDYGGFRPPRQVFDGVGTGQDLAIEPNTHAHANWAFSEPGTYEVTFTATIVSGSGETARPSADLRFLVGDAASAAVPADGGANTGMAPAVAATAVVLALAAVTLLRRRAHRTGDRPA
ncbi:choice-of-anchor M domain-containing protein [Streptomyces sp. RFCAC02]|uniref:choice-of-anchor M domain-containing protein n=1 Tax=Streptomyces sp. RFCAC02 TaxID=2499143 RepID=UPI0010229E61|nr:choice-of-anchor M domain-containing protein [Streptomyces sp. RFCAC02]